MNFENFNFVLENSYQNYFSFVSFFIHLVTIEGHLVELIVSSKGKLQLLIDGYKYYRNSIDLNKQSFRCAYYKSALRYFLDRLIILNHR